MATTRVSRKFNRCVKSVRKTVRARRGSNKESAAIGICTKSVLHKRGRTMKRYRNGRLTTQKKFRGGATPGPNPVYTWTSIADYIDETLLRIGNNQNAMTDLENYVIGRIREVREPPTEVDRNAILSILTLAIQTKSKEMMRAMYERGVRKDFMLDILNALQDDPEIRREIEALQPVAANLS